MRARGTHLTLAAVVVLTGAATGGCGRTPGSAAESKSTADVIFENVTDKTGIDFTISHSEPILSILDTIGHGAAMIDADSDGLLDLVFTAKDRIRLYKNLGGFRFQNVTDQAGLQSNGTWGGIAVGDFDNDGLPDIFVPGYDCSALFRNLGGGSFQNVTADSGLEVKKPPAGKCPEWRTTAGWVDYDRDGLLDLFVCRYAEFGPNTIKICSDPTKGEKYVCSPDVYRPQRPSLFKNLGAGRFREVTAETGIDKSFGRSLGVAFGDYNDDGYPDIAVANDERPGDLFTNLGGKRFVNDGPKSGTAYSALGRVHGGMGIDWSDFDADGRLDLFVTTYENEAKNLYHNLGNGLFTDKALDAGLAEKMDRYVGWGVKFLDYDLDGRPDLLVTSGHVMNNTARLYPGTSYPQPIQLFQNREGRYEETTSMLSAKAQELVVGRALAAGDLDNDGRIDAVISRLEGAPIILRNLLKNDNQWVAVRLTGKKSNRDGFGARVTLTTDSGRQVKECYSAGSYMASHDPRVRFGLAKAARVKSVEIVWPSGARQELTDLEANHEYRVTEGEAFTTAGR